MCTACSRNPIEPSSSDCLYDTIEPFRIRSLEPIPLLSREERQRALERAGYNLFGLQADEVTIDLLTDSGTGAMSSAQWSALLSGDESYAGSTSFRHLEKVVRRLTGHQHVFPVHQGRAAERILAETLLGPGKVVLNNTHFDTTRANFTNAGALAIDLPVPEAMQHEHPFPFKGNMDLNRLQQALEHNTSSVAFVMMTLTNNATGGHPVSLANLEAVRDLCIAYNVPLMLDAARFAENAWFVQQREPGFSDWPVKDIAQCAFMMADGFTLSAKKDGLVHIGGLLCTKRLDWAERFREALILGEGFTTYGGLAGRDLDAMAIGLQEALDPLYLRYRIGSVAYLAQQIEAQGLPVLQPPGGHAVHIDARKCLPHISPNEFPADVLANALYVEGGVRGVGIGTLMFPQANQQLTRLAIPRRVYTRAHMDYVALVAGRVMAKADSLTGLKIIKAPEALRHFSATLAPVDGREETRSHSG